MKGRLDVFGSNPLGIFNGVKNQIPILHDATPQHTYRFKQRGGGLFHATLPRQISKEYKSELTAQSAAGSGRGTIG